MVVSHPMLWNVYLCLSFGIEEFPFSGPSMASVLSVWSHPLSPPSIFLIFPSDLPLPSSRYPPPCLFRCCLYRSPTKGNFFDAGLLCSRVAFSSQVSLGLFLHFFSPYGRHDDSLLGIFGQRSSVNVFFISVSSPLLSNT